MKHKSMVLLVVWGLVCTMDRAQAGEEVLGTGFTYQGRLNVGGVPAQGDFDMEFRLFDDATGGAQVGPVIEISVTEVADGLFEATLDFGGDAFADSAKFLQISVRQAGSPAPMTVLAPRQPVTPVPQALVATRAGAAVYADSAFVAQGLIASGATVEALTSVENMGAGSALEAVNSGDGPAISAEAGNAPAIFALAQSEGAAMFVANGGTGAAAVFMGNVGIGTQTPAEKFSVMGVVESKSGGFRFPDGTLQTSASEDVWMVNEAGDASRAGGNVGIGTDVPSELLHINRPMESVGVRMQTTRFVAGDTQVSSEYPQNVVTTGTGAVWFGLASVQSSDDVRTSASMMRDLDVGIDLDETQTLGGSDLGFQIPVGAVIQSIHVDIEGFANSSCVDCDNVYVQGFLALDGQANVRSFEWYSSENTAMSLEYSGNGWTPDMVNSSSFGIQLFGELMTETNLGSPVNPVMFPCPSCKGSAQVYVDAITIRVVYFDPTGDSADVNFVLGVPQSSPILVMKPDSTPSLPTTNLPQANRDGGIYMDAEGRIGIGIEPTTAPLGPVLRVDGIAQSEGWQTSSSRRWKKNVLPLGNGLEAVLKLQGVSWVWDQAHGGRPDIGFIAEDVGNILPQIVDYESDGVNATGMKYDRITAVTVEAIKELHAQLREKSAHIQAQSDEIASMRRELNDLRAEIRGISK